MFTIIVPWPLVMDVYEILTEDTSFGLYEVNAIMTKRHDNPPKWLRTKRR